MVKLRNTTNWGSNMEYVKCNKGGCPARSLVQVAKILLSRETEVDELMTLEMCGHHFNKEHASLVLLGFEVIEDDRGTGQIYDAPKFTSVLPAFSD